MADTGGRALEDLLAIMARLRDPQHGCPWDVAQDFSSIAAYTVEEAYEVADAIDRGDFDDLRDELGDLLLQVVFHAQMARERGLFDFDDVAAAIASKMRRRHPHVFGDVRYADLEEQKRAWEAIKAQERAERGMDDDSSVLAGISHGQPEWRRAQALQNRAARTGFEWTAPEPILDKLAEELDELREAFEHDADPAHREEELGDLLFVAINLARQSGLDYARAIRQANAKFERRFRAMEQLAAAQGRRLDEVALDAQEGLWDQAKAAESAGGA